MIGIIGDVSWEGGGDGMGKILEGVSCGRLVKTKYKWTVLSWED